MEIIDTSGSMRALFMTRGTCTMGQTTRDKDGNIIKQIPAKCEADPDGSCVIVGRIKFTDNGIEQDGSAEVFGDWDAAGYLAYALELLNPHRRINIPPFESIVKAMVAESCFERTCPFENYSTEIYCKDCIVDHWIEETVGPEEAD